MTKGTQIAVDGYLKQDRWEKEGQKFSRVVIVAEKINLVGGKKEGGEKTENQNTPSFNPNIPENDNNGYPEDIPF